MSQEVVDVSLGVIDKKRRMSLKGPPLRVAMKQTAPVEAKPAPQPAPRAAPVAAPVSDRRQSLSARQVAKLTANKAPAVSALTPKKPITAVPIEPLAAINSRLDAVERQVADIHGLVARIVALEEFVKPLKPSLQNLQSDIQQLNTVVKQLQSQSTEPETHSEATDGAEDIYEAAMEDDFATDDLDALDRSFDNGEIDINRFASSLHQYINPKSSVGSAETTRSMSQSSLLSSASSSPQVTATYRFTPQDNPSTTPAPAITQQLAQATTTVKVETKPVEQKSAISSQPAKLPSHALVATTAPTTAPTTIVKSVSVANIAPSKVTPLTSEKTIEKEAAENVSMMANVQSRSKKRQDTNIQIASGDSIFPMMEPVVPEEKPNVQYWLGVTISEANRAIAMINEFATTQRFELNDSNDIIITVDDVATQCAVDQKRAKAITLVLCNLKRLRILRSEGGVMQYCLQSTTTFTAPTKA